jgi:diacylglycerol O-acyltransferase / wax synthase
MPVSRLSALDASFLDVETSSAHMHVGWAATFTQPESGRRRDYEDLFAHIAGRLWRSRRYMQKLAPVPLGVYQPQWIDDDAFDPRRHIRRADPGDLGAVVDSVMSRPLARDRPLWEMWIVEELPEDRIGFVGKAHHCMVDGLAAVELATLLLDRDPSAGSPAEETPWVPSRQPGAYERLLGAADDFLRDQVGLARRVARFARSPRQLAGVPREVSALTRTLDHTVASLAPRSMFNRNSSPTRHLASVKRPLDDLREIKSRFGTTVNDVVLAACAGAIRRYLAEHDEQAAPLKTMVPVSVRTGDEELGNRISFMFVSLPCDEPDPVRRLERVNAVTSERKQDHEPEELDSVLQAASHLPRPVQTLLSRLMASPRAFNLVVSNIPGPRERLWMYGCELQESYPIVPLAEGHALSIGMTTVCENACFGLYADREALPDVDRLAAHLDDALDELLDCR